MGRFITTRMKLYAPTILIFRWIKYNRFSDMRDEIDIFYEVYVLAESFELIDQ